MSNSTSKPSIRGGFAYCIGNGCGRRRHCKRWIENYERPINRLVWFVDERECIDGRFESFVQKDAQKEDVACDSDL